MQPVGVVSEAWTQDFHTAFDVYADSCDLQGHFHTKQKKIAADGSGFVAVLGARRSGKTDCLLNLALQRADQFPGETVPMVYPTLRGGRDIVLPKVSEIMARTGVHFDIALGESKIHTPLGGTVQLFGLGTLPDVEKGRGKRFPYAVFEECGAHRQALLETAVAETFGPACADFDGLGGYGLAFGGTPSYLKDTYWSKICGGNTHRSELGATVHHMTIRDNPFFAGREDGVEEAWLKRNGEARDGAKFQREWKGLFCVDHAGLCFGRWSGSVLEHNQIPAGGVTVMGLDLGTRDANAWAVVRFVPSYTMAPDGKSVRQRIVAHICEVMEMNEIRTDEIADITRLFVERWGVSRVFADGGGGGLQTVLDLRDLYDLPIEPVIKTGRVRWRIQSLDSGLGTGQVQVHEACSALVESMGELTWNDDKSDANPLQANHAASAAMYAMTGAQSMATVDFALPPAPGSPEYEREQAKLDRLAMRIQ